MLENIIQDRYTFSELKREMRSHRSYRSVPVSPDQNKITTGNRALPILTYAADSEAISPREHYLAPDVNIYFASLCCVFLALHDPLLTVSSTHGASQEATSILEAGPVNLRGVYAFTSGGRVQETRMERSKSNCMVAINTR